MRIVGDHVCWLDFS